MEFLDADPRILRALAHPVRATLMYELHARGATTATTLSEALDVPVNSVSFHLRQLARYGLIEEAPELATDGRQRWWRPASTRGLAFSSDEVAAQPGGEAALELFQRHSIGWWQAMVAQFFADEHDDVDAVRALNDVPVFLTDDEARQLATEIYEVLTRWMDHGQRASADDGDDQDAARRRTYLCLSMVMPQPPVDSSD